MSKKNKIIIGVGLVAVLVAVCCIAYLKYGQHYMRTGPGGYVEANRAMLSGGGGGISVTVKEGEKLVIRSYLKEGSIRINLGKQEKAQTGEETPEELMNLFSGKDIEQVVEGYNTYAFEVPEGYYVGSALTEKTPTTGKVKITSEAK